MLLSKIYAVITHQDTPRDTWFGQSTVTAHDKHTGSQSDTHCSLCSAHSSTAVPETSALPNKRGAGYRHYCANPAQYFKKCSHNNKLPHATVEVFIQTKNAEVFTYIFCPGYFSRSWCTPSCKTFHFPCFKNVCFILKPLCI